jgi:ABC-type transport system involved in cytochrome bd biosynthesis fused ATPase/permease subunit
VLLLDDIFSSVDARTESIILDNMVRVAGARTVIMVCHRTAALHRAECIHLLEQGEIVASGTHAELMAGSLLYQGLHQQMARHEALESLQ